MLEIKNLTKTYKGGKTAVDNLSLTVRPGDIYGFIGHNGAGKTTTIKAVVGIHDFDSGEILVDGKDVRSRSLDCKRVTAYNVDKLEFIEPLHKEVPADPSEGMGDEPVAADDADQTQHADEQPVEQSLFGDGLE